MSEQTLKERIEKALIEDPEYGDCDCRDCQKARTRFKDGVILGLELGVEYGQRSIGYRDEEMTRIDKTFADLKKEIE